MIDESNPTGEKLCDLREHLSWSQIYEIWPEHNPNTLRRLASDYRREEAQLVLDEDSTIFLSSGGNVLVIGDTHLPFVLPQYLEFCARVRDRYKCDTVIHIGDLVDNHAQSYHESDPDGMSAGAEFDAVLEMLELWFNEFERVFGCMGNHDKIPARKAMSLGLSRHAVRSFRQMWGLPRGWRWAVKIKKDGVTYTHGTGNAGKTPSLNRAEKKMTRIVSGHIHTAGGVWWSYGEDARIFGLNVGCGVDASSYAAAYARDTPKEQIYGCGVVLDNGQNPQFVAMPENVSRFPRK